MVNRSGQDVLALLARDHDEWRAWLARIEEAGEGNSLLRRLRDEVSIHGQVADEIVYPAFGAMLDDEDAERLAEESRDDHAFIGQLLDEALRVPRDSVSFGEALLLSRECIERHADEEEDKMFPRMAMVCSPAMLEHMGQRFQQRRETLRRQVRRRRIEAGQRPLSPLNDASAGADGSARHASTGREAPARHASADVRRAGGLTGLSKTELMERLRRK